MTTSSPTFLHPKQTAPKQSRRVYWLWFTVIFLSITLVLQILVADRVHLAADPVWRPRIEHFCDFLRCTLPPWREPNAFHIISRDIHPHPSASEALLVTASFRNDAKFPQPWPQLELSLANLDGESLGLRRFSPNEYLGNIPATSQIAAGQSASIALEILDPGKRAVAFSFEFH